MRKNIGLRVGGVGEGRCVVACVLEKWEVYGVTAQASCKNPCG